MSSRLHSAVPIAAVTAAVAALLVSSGGPATADTPPRIGVPVDPGIVIQDDFQGFGTSLAWWADVVGGWSEPARTQMLDLLFADSANVDGQTVPGLGLDVVRYNAGASEPGVDYPVVDPHLPPRNGAWIESLVKADGTYDWSADANQRLVLGAAAERGASTFELFANSAPWWMTYSGHPAGRYSRNSAEGCQNSNLRTEYQDEFADYLATVADQFATVGINGPGSATIDFTTIEPFNEPSNGWWCWGNNQEGTFLTAGEQSAIIEYLSDEITAHGLDVGISATDSNNYWLVVSELDALTESAKEKLSQINAHGYAGSDVEPVRDRVDARDMRFWQSEWGPAGWGGYDITSELDAALELATRVTNDLSYAEANAWLYWQAVEDSTRGDGPGFWGLIQATLDGSAESYDLQKQYYMLGQYSRFIEPGDLIIDSGNGKSVAAFDPDGQQLVLVTYNDTDQPMPVSYDLSRFSLGDSGASGWRTSDTENLVALPDAAVTGTALDVTVPAYSIVTSVLDDVAIATAATGEIVNDDSGFVYSGNWSDNSYSGGQVGAYGLWDQDEHSSQSYGATAEYTFTGTGVRLYGTVAPSSGLAEFSIDGAPAEVVDLSQASRFDGSHVWSSGDLPLGRHTVTVRVLGASGSGGGNWVNVDRAAIELDDWNRCADVNDTCDLAGVQEVRYGFGDARLIATDDVTCSAVTFGAAEGVGADGCWTRDVSTASLVAAHSGKCAGVASSGTTAGTEVVQWNCLGVDDQAWQLTPATGGFQVKPTHTTGMCLSSANGSSGAGIQQDLCGTSASTWTFTPVRDGYYTVSPTANPELCMDVPGASLGNGTALIQYDCNRYPNQLWKLAVDSH